MSQTKKTIQEVDTVSLSATRLPPPPRPYAPPREPRLTVLHVDDDILVVAKPSGLLSVPGRGPDLADCVETRARSEYPDVLIVHRLDLETSGVMLMARNPTSQRHLGHQFEQRTVQKTYIARVHGHMSEDEGVVDAPLSGDWPNRPRQKIDFERGRPARTLWRVLDREPNATRLELRPETGRTHQLRVHLHHIGHAILGDRLYGCDVTQHAANRVQLHASSLGFIHPRTHTPCEFSCPCPF